jgi:lactate permease
MSNYQLSVSVLYSLLALLPIGVLVLLALWKNLNVAVAVSFAVTAALFFYWQAPASHFFASLLSALVSSISILMIVSGAMFLYQVMETTGYIGGISRSMQQIHPSREVSFFLMALGLTAFFEGVAGFGTPGAIVPLLLMALGYNALLSVSVVLLTDSLTAVAGAVGTPVLTGLQLPLALPEAIVQSIYAKASVIIAVAGAVVLLFVLRLYRRQAGPVHFGRKIWMMYAFFVVPLIGFAAFAGEFSVILAACSTLLLSALVLRQGKGRLEVTPWIPYLALIILLLLPRLVPPLKALISWKISFDNILSTGIGSGIQPLALPLVPFAAVGVVVLYARGQRSFPLWGILRKVLSVFLILYPAIAISQLMVHSGTVRPSMVAYLSMLLQHTGPWYVLFAPLLGTVGAFITGSTTVSNLVFGAAQLETARMLGADPSLVLALQLCGASLGNAVCLFNVIAAASVANLTDYKQVLKDNLLPTVAAALTAGLCGLGMAYLLS